MLKRVKKQHQGNIEKTKKAVKLDTLKNLKIAYIPYNELLKEGFFAGLGWAFGVTIGFVILSTLLVIFLKFLGGLPLVGSGIASVVEATQQQLIKRTPLIRNY
jgi:hypothetical protein